VASALASFQSGRASLLSVLDLQNTVFTYETAYYRSLSDFAKGLAELEQVTGTDVLP
jgi:outer membrane protein TolC